LREDFSTYKFYMIILMLILGVLALRMSFIICDYHFEKVIKLKLTEIDKGVSYDSN